MMIESVGDDSIACERGRRFEAVFRLELPDNAAVLTVQAIDIAVGRRKINPARRRLMADLATNAAPKIFVQTASNKIGFPLPNNFQRPILPGSGTVEIAAAGYPAS